MRLRNQAGWKSVIYKGDGVYAVDFQISGVLSHDFSFPTIEKLRASPPFLVTNLRTDRTVRISSPLLDQPGSAAGNALGLGTLGAILTAEAEAPTKDPGTDPETAADPGNVAPLFPEHDGTFTLTTDAEVLTNNTDDRPQADSSGKRLVWKIDPRHTPPQRCCN